MDWVERIVQANSKRFLGPRTIECDPGWENLILQFLFELDTFDPKKKISLFCIKEKFGFLDISNEACDEFLWDELSKLLFNYRLRSKSICEVCGNRGKLRSFGTLLKTTCEGCRLDRK